MELNAGTKKMLSGLGSEDVTVEDLAQHIADAGVFVELHVRRCRGTLALPPKAVGVRVDRMSQEAREAYNDLVRLGSLSFIPKDDENKLAAIETSLRRRLYDLTTTDGFMPSQLFESFKAEFLKAKQEYMAQRDAIGAEWENLTANFSARMKAMVDGIRMPQRDRKRIHEAIMKNLPSKGYYLDSFDMAMTVKAFPALSTCSASLPADLQDAIKDSWAEMTVSLAEQSIISLLVEVFDDANKAVAGYMKKGIIHGRCLNKLEREGERLEKMNLFNNSMVTSTAKLLTGLKDKDPADTEALLEQCIIDIYHYADSVGYELSLENLAFDEALLVSAA